MSFAGDLRILYHMTLAPIRGKNHAERMEEFYNHQAGAYDDFRRRLLHGREELYQKLPTPPGGVWIEMGGGTASNLEYLGERIRGLSSVTVVDLAPSLLKVASERAAAKGWTNVQTVEADVTTFSPGGAGADVVTFSYSLTMIPDWFAAMDQAIALLKPGGVLGVVDFFVSRKYPADGRSRHSWFTRNFWPVWFGTDNVHPSADHIPYLTRRLETVVLDERSGKVPYVPFVRAPYYLFVGRKPSNP
jgi:S-adenosylmethionine-diacylgycerolhomoserine-N-methlytransferase